MLQSTDHIHEILRTTGKFSGRINYDILRLLGLKKLDSFNQSSKVDKLHLTIEGTNLIAILSYSDGKASTIQFNSNNLDPNFKFDMKYHKKFKKIMDTLKSMKEDPLQFFDCDTFVTKKYCRWVQFNIRIMDKNAFSKIAKLGYDFTIEEEEFKIHF